MWAVGAVDAGVFQQATRSPFDPLGTRLGRSPLDFAPPLATPAQGHLCCLRMQVMEGMLTHGDALHTRKWRLLERRVRMGPVLRGGSGHIRLRARLVRNRRIWASWIGASRGLMMVMWRGALAERVCRLRHTSWWRAICHLSKVRHRLQSDKLANKTRRHRSFKSRTRRVMWRMRGLAGIKRVV